MGAWGTEPWDNDEAADWFNEFFEGIDVNARIRETFREFDDNQDRIRAACFILGTLGRVYVWPGDLDELKQLLDRGTELLSRMLSPLEGDEDFVAAWTGEDRPAVVASIQEQIAQLKARRAEIV